MLLYSAALNSWPFESIVKIRVRLSSWPDGRLTFCACTALCTSSMPMPRAASCDGSSWIRTAYFCEPYTTTCATPGTIEIRCARRVSPNSSTSDIGSVSEVSISW